MNKEQIISKAAHLILVSAVKLIVVTFAILVIWTGKVALDTWEERDGLQPVPLASAEEEALPPGLLASRIIDMEVDAGLATEPDKARQILAGLLLQARAIQPPIDPTTSTVRAYFKDISLLIDRYYYYRKSTTFTEGLIDGGIDCDLRSILFQTIAAASSFDIGIIYAPSHAFVGWQAPDNSVSVYWETTVRGGRAAVLSNTSLYQNSADPAAYKLLTKAESEDLYGSWIYADAYERTKEAASLEKVAVVAERQPTWHYPQFTKLYSLYIAYGIQDQRTLDQLRTYTNLNGNDDWGKRFNMHHYKMQGKNEMALATFHEISKSAREPEDFDLASEVSGSAIEWLKYAAIAASFDALQKFKQTLFQKAFNWSEYSVILNLIITATLTWLITPPLLQLLKVPPTRKTKASALENSCDLQK